MVRPTDQERTSIKKIVCGSQIPRGGDKPHHPGYPGEGPGSIRRPRGRENVDLIHYRGFCGRNRRGRISGLRIIYLSNISGVWDPGAVPGGLLPGPEVFRTAE